MMHPVKHPAQNAGWSLLHPERPGIDPGELARRDADANSALARADGAGGGSRPWRSLTPAEIDRLRAQGNQAADWASVLACDPFDPALVHNCRFLGLVRLGKLEPVLLGGGLKDLKDQKDLSDSGDSNGVAPTGPGVASSGPGDSSGAGRPQDASAPAGAGSPGVPSSEFPVPSSPFRVPAVPGGPFAVGLRDSTLVSCDLGDNVVVERVGRLAHVIVGDEAILQGVGRVETTPDAVFGTGRPRGPMGERLWIEVGNENGGRAVLPFVGMLPADAWLWSRRRQDATLMDRLRAMTDAEEDAAPGRYSFVGARAVLLDCGALVDVRIGPAARLEGALRLESVTLMSDPEAPCVVAAGAVAAEGIVGPGARLGQGVQARRFVLGENARVESGARLFHCVLGDNSTVACCEVLHCLIFPFHEQHHNNSFLIAATLQGQSNVAAGATIGSNHNSRSPDGEILAGRGFWPGLCSNFKHNCRFATHVLVAKGNYPFELNVTLPFSLLAPAEDSGQGLVMRPAWWFLHDMHAVQRNQWKFRARDRRHHARQHVVCDALAPDVAEEILSALKQLEAWTGAAILGCPLPPAPGPWASDAWTDPGFRSRGRHFLLEQPGDADALDLKIFGIENSRRPARVLKAGQAYGIYYDMLLHGAIRALVDFLDATPGEKGSSVFERLASSLGVQSAKDRERCWENFGGQLVAGADADRLRAGIASGALACWGDIHAELDRLWLDFPKARARHALAVLFVLEKPPKDQPAIANWRSWIKRAAKIQERIIDLVERSRAKDFSQPYRRITYDSPDEMTAILGRAENDPFLRQVKDSSLAFILRLNALLE